MAVGRNHYTEVRWKSCSPSDKKGWAYGRRIIASQMGSSTYVWSLVLRLLEVNQNIKFMNRIDTIIFYWKPQHLGNTQAKPYAGNCGMKVECHLNFEPFWIFNISNSWLWNHSVGHTVEALTTIKENMTHMLIRVNWDIIENYFWYAVKKHSPQVNI